MIRFSRLLPVFVLILVAGVSAMRAEGTPYALVRDFQNPPESAKPWVIWYWMQASVSREGITADLEAMKQAGIGGAYFMAIQDMPTPAWPITPVRQLTEEWWGMVMHAFKEADRLGLKIAMHACDGFATSGGPWITPELSMQRVVWSETRVSGGKTGKVFSGVLPQPPTKENYYRDIAVLAFPTQAGAGVSTRTVVPVVTTSEGADASMLPMGKEKARYRAEDAGWIQYAFAESFTARSLVVQPDGTNMQGLRLRVEASEDGKDFLFVAQLEPARQGWQHNAWEATFALPETTARYFRFVWDPAGSEPGSEDMDAAKWRPILKVTRLELSSEARIEQFEGKSGALWRIGKRTTSDILPEKLAVAKGTMVDLTSKLGADGKLNWDMPAGAWTILRVGHTSTGQHNETAGAGKGLEADKFNPAAARLNFDQWFGEAMRRAGPELSKRVLAGFHLDSWECGSQNWSPVFQKEFERRRGYDPRPWLPAMAGIPVESAEASETFLHDVRTTIGELIVDNFVGVYAELARVNGKRFTAESVSPVVTSDNMRHFEQVDLPMGEFWLRSPTHDKPNDMRDTISAARVYGKKIIGAEAFTELKLTWDEHPGMLKALGDRNYALGVNHFAYHVFMHNPWPDRKPGMTLGGVGTFFQRDQTWWRPGAAWFAYAHRVQAVLQQGVPVVDVAVFTGEEMPRRAVLPERLTTVLPGLMGEDAVKREAVRLANVGQPMKTVAEGVSSSANTTNPADWTDPLRGYAYDSINRDALLRLATVRDGRIVLPGGASYGVLVLPGANPMNPSGVPLSAEVAKRVGELKKLGAKIIDAPWTEETLDSLKIARDFVAMEKGEEADKVAWTHRRVEDVEVYFVSNQLERTRSLEFSLRVDGSVPEIWNTVTGEIIEARSWWREKGRTVLPLELAAAESVFVVFREKTTAMLKSERANQPFLRAMQELTGSWTVAFEKRPAAPGAPVYAEALFDWSKHSDAAVRHFSGTAQYKRVFSFNAASSRGRRVWLDLGEVANLAEVYVNGVNCGVAWTPPYHVEVTRALKDGDNELRVGVTNTWANRLIGDAELPEAERVTWTTAKIGMKGRPLLKAGLLGPVRLMREE
ncbi:DNA-binding protein [Nibricoccus aquaticus]|uniref:DNA-binding protein n=1 Tax=Nibricoccus aquaticus TaxID=2576891 RepID=A0A290Q3V7_9BACT|nr:glycosyl hydrolase [Nibricoccus aquaticus]ATC63355.1 DNA-binding protein [Nibricoccus aquaticus]